MAALGSGARCAYGVLPRRRAAELGLIDTVTLTDRLGMDFRLTEIPVGYPVKSSVDFDPRYMRQLFDYGERCASAGLLWITPKQANRLNMDAHRQADGVQPACPGRCRVASTDARGRELQ